MNTSPGQLGAWVGGFLISMVFSYVLLRFAGSAKRNPSIAIALRAVAVLVAAFLTYASYIGAGGQLNLGGALAVIVTAAWAVKQQLSSKPA